MKKYIFVFVSFLLLLPIITAVEFDMKTEFSQGETLIAKVSGNFIDAILKENIFFYRGHVRIPINFNVAKINNEFCIYASLLDKNPNNYSIAIENVRYMKGNQVSEEDITQNFSITHSTADFSANPGFVITKDDFFIEVQNLQDYKINIDISPLNLESEKTITLKSGETKKINFELKNISRPTTNMIELSTENLNYKIPVYVFKAEGNGEVYVNETDECANLGGTCEWSPCHDGSTSLGQLNCEVLHLCCKDDENGFEKKRDFKFKPSQLDISMATDSNITKIIYLYNTGQETLENITLLVSNSLKNYLNLSIKEINKLNADSNTKINLYLSSQNKEKTIEGEITAKQGDNLYTYCAVFLNFTKDYNFLNKDEEIITTETCAEMDGEICDNEEKCDGNSVYAKDDKCCLGSCEKIEKSSTGKIIGWTIIIIIVVSSIWFFKTKYKGARKEVDLFKIGKRR